MAADVTANVFPSVQLSKMLIFRGYFSHRKQEDFII